MRCAIRYLNSLSTFVSASESDRSNDSQHSFWPLLVLARGESKVTFHVYIEQVSAGCRFSSATISITSSRQRLYPELRRVLEPERSSWPARGEKNAIEATTFKNVYTQLEANGAGPL